MAKTKIKFSSNIEAIEFVEKHKELDLLPGFGAMIVTFKRTNQDYAYYPMSKEIYDYHHKKMVESNSPGKHFDQYIKNLFENKKL